jgi:uncharacterized protein (TIGR02117 family)
MNTIKQTLKFLFKSIIFTTIFVLVYILCGLGLSKISVNENISQKKEVEIFIKTNGVHTDIVVPIQNEIKDWRKEIKFSHTKSQDSIMNYLAFGWGDKGFYLDTPEWADLKFSTAFKAATGLSTTAMHTTFYKTMIENESCKKVIISQENYQKLVNYISNSFLRDSKQQVQWLSGHSYSKNDAFYNANGRYSLFKTCNSWANSSLKESNQKAAFWTPYDGGIFCHYK